MTLTEEISFLLNDHVDHTGFVDEYEAAQELTTLICDGASRAGMDTPSFESFLRCLRSRIKTELYFSERLRELELTR